MKDINSSFLLEIMQYPELKNKNIYLHPERGEYILRSSSIHSLGEYIRPELNPEMSPWSKKRKRMLDVSLSILMVVLWPISSMLLRSPLNYISNLIKIIKGDLSFVGFSSDALTVNNYLIDLGADIQTDGHYRAEKERLDYLVNYSVIVDLELIFSNLSLLDSKNI